MNQTIRHSYSLCSTDQVHGNVKSDTSNFLGGKIVVQQKKRDIPIGYSCLVASSGGGSRLQDAESPACSLPLQAGADEMRLSMH